jgi:hypothetical protein
MLKLPVRIERIEKQRKTSGLMHAIAGFYLMAMTVSALELTGRNPLFYVVLLVSVALVIYGFARKKLDPAARWNIILRAAAALCFVVVSVVFFKVNDLLNAIALIIWAAISFYLFFNEKNLFKAQSLELSDEGIRIPGSGWQRILQWRSVNSFVARPDFITIFQPGNKFIQLELSTPVDPSVLQNANDFCNKKIEQAGVPEAI